MEYLDKVGLSTLWTKVKSYVTSQNFIKSSDKGKANGVASLDGSGNVPLSQLGNIDTTLFKIVQSLPTTEIIANKIYLVKAFSTSTQNIYAEYIYTGDVDATYDATKWEKLGEYKADIDLSSYAKTETVNAQLAKKVDVISGKGLSTNDYTTAEKNKLAGIPDFTAISDTYINSLT